MCKMIAIAKRELHSYFVSPIAYFVITGFLLLSSYFFFNLLGYFNAMLAKYSQMPPYMLSGQPMPNLNQWVVEGYYQTILLILVFLIPFLTMRTLAEEKKKGTFELLMTSPVSVWDIVVGKYLGVSVMITIMLSLSFVFPLLLIYFGNPEVAPILSGFAGLLLCALCFASIGLASSAFSENQVVSGVVGIVVLLLFYVIDSPAENIGGVTADILHYLSPLQNTRGFIQGVITTKALIYFASVITLGIFFSQRALDAQRWR